MLFETVLKSSKSFFFFFSRKHNAFYIELLYKVRYFVNNVTYGWNLYILLLTNDLSSIRLKWSKKEADINKSITYIRNKIEDFHNTRKS